MSHISSTNIEQILSELTLEEKASLCSGKDFWSLKGIKRLNLPSIMVTDGPHGLRKQQQGTDHLGMNQSNPATCFPTASALAASWDRELLAEIGVALGDECREEKISILLGPGVNIKRSPLCGRNFEYFSEDPFLSGEMAAAKIRAIQSRGVGTSLKHFAVNNQEFHRMSINTVVDERTLREIYFPAFETTIKKAQPWSVMCAYNQLNNEYCSQNRWLLTDVLRNEWGFSGLVVTDWGATLDRVKGLEAGLDLEMPGSTKEHDIAIVEAVNNGSLDELQLNQTVRRLLKLITRANYTLETQKLFKHVPEDHHALARKAASESMVLLKNEHNILPIQLDGSNSIAVIGDFAQNPRYQGSGSSRINPTQLESVMHALNALTVEGEPLSFAQGYQSNSSKTNQHLFTEAQELAKSSHTVLFFGGLTDEYETEGVDRSSLALPPNQTELIHALSEVNARVIVILSNGAPVEMPWIKEVPAVLETYLTGQAWGTAVIDIITGKVNPSGKLAETFPIDINHCPATANFPAGPFTVEYREALAIGYRYYSTVNAKVLFPFGHGLSYTTFKYSKLRAPLFSTLHRKVNISLQVNNSGERTGKEIVQIYVRKVGSKIIRPDRELRAFTKVEIPAGEHRTVHLSLNKRAFSFWDTEHSRWAVENGKYEIIAAASVEDIRLITTIRIRTTDKLSNYALKMKETFKDHVFHGDSHWNTHSAFSKLYGKVLPMNQINSSQYTEESTVAEVSHTLVGSVLNKLIHKGLKKAMNSEQLESIEELTEKMVAEMPLRQLVMITQGEISHKKVQTILHFINGRWGKGVKAIIKNLT